MTKQLSALLFLVTNDALNSTGTMKRLDWFGIIEVT